MSKIDVINYALTIMDAQMIDTLEESESARIITAEYSRAAKRALEQVAWNFATIRQSLGNVTTSFRGRDVRDCHATQA